MRVFTLKPPDIVRFWSFVSRGGDDDCWPWLGGVSDNGYSTGYGHFNVGGKAVGAHRIAYLIVHGKLPRLNICHSCDTPLCMNPAHLFTGTQAANIADMVAKGRQAKGDRNGSRLHPEAMPRGDAHWTRRYPDRVACGDAHGSRLHPETRLRGEQHSSTKLTDAQKDTIRRRWAAYGVSQRMLAREYGVTPSCISLVVKATERHGNGKLTDAKRDAIRQRYAAGGISQQALGREYDVTQSCISDIINEA